MPTTPAPTPTQTAVQITSSVTLEGIVTVVFNADKDGMQAAFAQSIIDSTGGLFEEIIDVEAAERQRLKSAVRKKEVVAVAAGKRPYYKKAREIREEQLTEQFQQLEKSGRLDNYMAKKRKQRASKQRKALPTYSDYTT